MVLLAVCLVVLVAFVAFAIDLGLLTLARTQLSDAADAAAMTGARALNGDKANNNNYAAVQPSARAVVADNSVLGKGLLASQLALRIGRFTYNTTNERFEGQYPGPSTENWNMVEATVIADLRQNMAFSKIFNLSLPNYRAVATAAHRPRDVCLVLDYSGSMRFGSLLGLPYSGSRSSNNQDTIYPLFGQYASSDADLQGAPASAPYDDANVSWTTADGRGPIVENFYTGAGGGAAFTPAADALSTTPEGDNFLKTNKNAGSSYAQTLAQVLNIGSPGNSTYNSTFETQGYRAFSMISGQLNRYTRGPKYWGKTFFIWPPDPSNGTGGATNDWRKRYFWYPGTTTAMDDNSRFWDGSGNWRAPGSTSYRINYNAILDFIKNIGPNPFPSRLQAGRILYYDAIPDTINTGSWPPADLNQRFWKDYIDYVLGVMQTGSSNYSEITHKTGYGDDFTWGTIRITAKSSLSGGSSTPYMHYGDNPKRPRLHFWFGPMTMIDFLGNYNLWYDVSPNCSRYCWWPGTCREAPLYACKLGIRAALEDINNNHPNDLVSLIMFSVPKESSGSTSAYRFNRVRVGLGRDYTRMQEALWYPPSTLGNSAATIRPYDSENLEVPRAMGGTCYAMALMLAHNQFSSNPALRTFNPAEPAGDAGGNGRRGAQKIIIFESDGEPNVAASATLTSGSAGQNYYRVRYNSSSPGGSEFPDVNEGAGQSSVNSQIYSLCTQMAAQESAGGFSTPSRKLLIHCIAFGPQGSAAADVLRQMQQIGNVTDNMPSYKIIDGTEATVIARLQTAIAKILQDGVQVSLIQ